MSSGPESGVIQIAGPNGEVRHYARLYDESQQGFYLWPGQKDAWRRKRAADWTLDFALADTPLSPSDAIDLADRLKLALGIPESDKRIDAAVGKVVSTLIEEATEDVRIRRSVRQLEAGNHEPLELPRETSQ